MQPTMCSRCKKHVAVVFITRLENGVSKNDGLCLKCAKDLGIKPIDDMMKKMGITDEDLESLTHEMMTAFGGHIHRKPCQEAQKHRFIFILAAA